MLLQVLAGRVHREQDARVRSHDNTARQDVAEDEQCHSVGARCAVLVGQVPVDAAGRAIRFRPVFPPVGQRRGGEQQGIEPGAGYEQKAMNRLKPVPCEQIKYRLVTWDFSPCCLHLIPKIDDRKEGCQTMYPPSFTFFL